MCRHYSGPEYEFPHGDARLDLTRLFAFPEPGDASKSILIMDVTALRLRQCVVSKAKTQPAQAIAGKLLSISRRSRLNERREWQ